MRHRPTKSRRPSLNHTYRLIWSEARQMYIAVAEHAKGRGKSGASASVIVTAVAGTIMALGSGDVVAADQTISGPVTSQQVLDNGDSLTVTPTGSVVIGGPLGGNLGTVLVDQGTTAGFITNEGTIGGPSDTGGIQVLGTVTGAVSNSGSIEGENYGIQVNGGNVGSIINSGSITSPFPVPAVQIVNSTIVGAIINTTTGRIGATGNPSVPELSIDNSTIQGGITNTGTIVDALSIDGSVITAAPGSANAIRNDGTVGGIFIDRIYATGVPDIRTVVNGSILNTGTVDGAAGYNGVLSVYESDVNGSISNTGTVTSSLDVDTSTVTGDIVNTNFIGALNIEEALIQGQVRNEGTISSSSTGVYLTSSTLVGGFTNSGKIESSGGAAVLLEEPVTLGGAGFLNAAGATISGAQKGIVLGYQSSSGGSAYLTAANVSGSIVNNGVINGTSVSGIELIGSTLNGDITNNAGGQITGFRGIRLIAGQTGTATAPTSVGSAINGSIINHDTITGGGNSFTVGAVEINEHSTITGNILNTGTIASGGGGDLAVRLAGATIEGGITNSGLVDGKSAPAVGFYGSASRIAGGFHNLEDGVIRSDSDAIMVNAVDSGTPFHTLSGGFHNAGQIISGNSYTVYLRDIIIEGDVINSLTGTITGNDGFYFTGNLNGGPGGIHPGGSTITGNLDNYGIIRGTWSGGVMLDRAVVQGRVFNAGSGKMLGEDTGLFLSDASVTGGITNAGTIQGGDFGILAEDDSTANITNSGLISGGEAGIHVSQAVVTGSVTNQAGGVISGGTEGGIWLYESSTITGSVNNAGTIVGTAAPGIFLSSESSIGGVTNSGLIRGDNGPGIFLSSSSSVQGSIVNQSGGTISGSDYGIRISDSSAVTGAIVNQANAKILGVNGGILVENDSTVGGIINSGLVQSSNNNWLYGAVVLDDGSSVAGNIVNQRGGQIAGAGQGLMVLSGSTVAGNIVNAGTISGDGPDAAGIQIQADVQSMTTNGSVVIGAIINEQDATITGRNFGVRVYNNSSLLGGLTNSGLIYGGLDDGIKFAYRASLLGGIANQSTGTIAGKRGIYLTSGNYAGGIQNEGTITGVTKGIVVNSGATLSGGIANTGLIQASAGNAVEFDWGSTLAGALVNSESGTIVGATGIYVGSNATNVIDGISNAGLISGTSKSLDLRNASNPITVNNSGTLQGDVYLGSTGNTLNLNGPSSRVIGNVSNDGASSTVNVNGTFTSEGTFDIGDLNVNDGGLFNWTTPEHTITANTMTVNTGGLLNVGTGNQTLNGNYVQESGGTFRFSLTNPETYGNMNVSGGNATLADGAKIDVRLNGRPGERIDGVIRTTGGVDATADKLIVTDNSLFYNFKADTSNPDPDSGTDKWLDLITEADTNALPNAVAPDNPAAIGVAQALQQIHNAGAPAGFQPVFDAMDGMSPEQLNDALLQLTPALQGAFAQAGINSLHSMNRIIQSRVESVQGLNSGDAGADQYAWARVFGNWGDQDNHRGVPGFETRTQGGVLGMDRPINDRIRAGGLFTYARTDIASKVGNANIDVDTFEIAAYGSYNIDPQTDVNAQVDFALNSADSQRRTFMGNMANANFDSFSWHVGTGIGHVFKLAERTSVTPSMRLDYTNFGTEGYTETGAGALNLAIDSSTYQEFLMTADAKLTQRLTDDGFKLVANGGAGYDFINQNAQITSTFTGGGPSFVTNGLDVSPWLFRGGLALIKEAGNGLEFSARYDTEGRTSGYINQTASLKVRWSF